MQKITINIKKQISIIYISGCLFLIWVSKYKRYIIPKMPRFREKKATKDRKLMLNRKETKREAYKQTNSFKSPG